MELLIITGMSGAGKTQVTDVFEDMGYYCVDNIPPLLIHSFLDITAAGSSKIEHLAIITDIRGGSMFKDVYSVLDKLTEENIKYRILFLDASDEVLIRRYKEHRRPHPLSDAGYTSIADAIAAERKLLRDIRARADFVIDTTYTSVAKLRENVKAMFLGNSDSGIKIQCMSFGFKYGPALEADLVFDVRCLPNPFYIDELKYKTGLDSEVFDYVMSFKESQDFADKICDLLEFSIELYRKEGKSQLTIAFGCTGGKHRSVTFAEYSANFLKSKGCNVSINHRDINK